LGKGKGAGIQGEGWGIWVVAILRAMGLYLNHRDKGTPEEKGNIMETIKAMTPNQIDAIWLQKHSASHRVAEQIGYLVRGMEKYVGRKVRGARGTIYLHPTDNRQMTTHEIVSLYANGEKTMSEIGDRAKYVAQFNEVNDELAAIKNEIESMDAEFTARGGWSRFFLVTSSSGHIHSSMHCHTCNKGRNATTFALLPSLSGANLEAAVAKVGAGLCSVCFPDAPAEYQEQKKISAAVATVLLETGDESKFDEAMAKADARAAKRLAKAGA
jgi:hypothetical protein